MLACNSDAHQFIHQGQHLLNIELMLIQGILMISGKERILRRFRGVEVRHSSGVEKGGGDRKDFVLS
jgi:hypothetical protein